MAGSRSKQPRGPKRQPSAEELSPPPWETEEDSPDQKFEIPVGRLIIDHGRLDYELASVLWAIIDAPNPAISEIIMSNISTFDQRIDVFSQMANIYFDNDYGSKIKNIGAELVEVNSVRNHIAHGNLSSFTWPPLKVAIRRYRRRSDKFGWKPYFYTPDEILSWAMRARSIRAQLARLREEILRNNAQRRASLRERQRTQSPHGNQPPNPETE